MALFSRPFYRGLLFGLVALSLPVREGVASARPAEITARHFAAAAAYSRRHGGETLRVDRDGMLLFEDYAPGYDADTPHKIYSGTKNFFAVLVLIAEQEGLLDLDEPACKTLPEWRHDGRREITLRQLLAQSAGLKPDASGYIYPYRNQLGAAVRVPLLDRPGTRFHYSAVNYQVVGEILRRKLARRGTDVEAYMTSKILDPLGIEVASWKHDEAGNPLIHTGLELTTAQWIKFGDYLVDPATPARLGRAGRFRELFTPATAVNPAYGLSFWLNHAQLSPPPQKLTELVIAMDGHQLWPGGPSHLSACIGSGKQRLYLLPQRHLAIARFGSETTFYDGEFLARLEGEK